MVDKHYIIYADESDKKGRFYSNFFGGVLLSAEDREPISRELNEKKITLGLNHELKWQNVDALNVDRYIEFIQTYFSYVSLSRLKIRIMFTQNMRIPKGLNHRHYVDQYFILYYQFIKHAFGIKYSDHGPLQNVYFAIYPDKIPDRKDRVEKFKDYLSKITSSRIMRGANVFIPRSNIADVDSKVHVILQGLDIILGSICSRLNNKFQEKSDGLRARGKRTRAKERLYKAINKEIRKIYPNFNVGVGTACHYGPSDLWTQPYRHWLFTSANHTIDRSLGKRAAPRKPT